MPRRANVIVGYAVALLVQVVLFPAFGLTVTLRQNLVIGRVFTSVSIARSYLLRRLFEATRSDAEGRVQCQAITTASRCRLRR